MAKIGIGFRLMLVIGMFLLLVGGLWAEEAKKADDPTLAKLTEETKKVEEPKVTGVGSIGFYNK
ncbi:MAG: hypothetical protein H6Q54_1589, partial [Deltaproteobacteria bacterium]|nr:hypothetical protein [Deltaproteobacteria bacterium]